MSLSVEGKGGDGKMSDVDAASGRLEKEKVVDLSSVAIALSKIEINVGNSVDVDVLKPLTLLTPANNNKEFPPGGEDVRVVVDSFLLPLRRQLDEVINGTGELEDKQDQKEIQLQYGGVENIKLATPSKENNVVDYLKALCEFIGEPDALLMNKAVLWKVLVSMRQQFDTKEGQTDVEDYLDYKPSEIMAFKAIQVFCAFALPQPRMFWQEMSQFKQLINDPRIAQDYNAQAAYNFIYDTLRGIFGCLLPEDWRKAMGISDTAAPAFQDLSLPSQATVGAMGVVFLKQFKLNPIDRLTKLRKIVKKDESNFELCLYLADHLRMKRRDLVCRERFPASEEMNVLENAFSIAPENPFVILSVLDTLIGIIRECSGRFFLGSLALNTVEASIRYLQDQCAELALKYPKNVMINSIVSDYFARYVPLRYFDIDFSLKTLMAAYETNPGIAKTTHRLGIFYRMSLGELDESFKWFSKTIELDPYHYGATMEYFKSLLGKGYKVDVLSVMLKIVNSPESESWTILERADMYFYLGIAYFIKGDYEGVWKWWKEAIALCETPFNLVDLSETIIHYVEDKRVVNIDQLRLWMQKEVQLIVSKEKTGEDFNMERKILAQRIFQLMIGIGQKPGRKAVKDFPFKREFPKPYLTNFISQ